MDATARIGSARPRQLATGVALALLTVAGSHLDAQVRATSPLWGDLASGPHRVGYRVVRLRDATRQSRRESTVAAAERGYPLLVRYWYPATSRAGAAPITFSGYLASDIVDDRLRDPTPDRIRESDRDLKAFYERAQNFPFGAVADDLWSRLGPTPLTAFADATPERGTFPILVGVGGALGNAVLGEYLASHGYVVSLVSSPAEIDLTAPARMEWYVRDVELALAHLRELPFADPRRVGTWGFSFAGMPALLAGMRAPEVDAVVSLESAIFYPQFAGQLRGNPFHEPTNLRVPFLHMMRDAESRPNEQLAGFEALRYSKRIRYLLNDDALVHQDFGTHGMAGPYGMGFRLEVEYDHSRRLAPSLDFEGKPNAGPLARSMQIGVWYPAAPGGSAPPIAYGELVAASATRGPLSAVTAANRAAAIRDMRAFSGFAFGREMTEGEASAIDAAPTTARRDATPVAGTFPVVLAATDGSLSGLSVVFEYLASHGIAVISAPSHRALATLQATRPAAAVETRVRDLEYLLARARGYPFVDTTRIAVLGVNFDGMAALAFQMKNMAAAAVVSIDGWEGKRNSIETVRAGLHFDPRRMRVPYLVVLQDEVNPPPGLRHDPAIFDAFAFSDRNRFVMTGLSHAYLVGNPLVYPATPTPQRAAYEIVARITRSVLSGALGLSAPTLASIPGDAETSRRALIKEAVHRPALPAVPDEAELERLIMNDQAVEKVEQFMRDMRRTDSTFVLFPQQTMALYAFRFSRQGNSPFALKLLELNAKAFPRSWSAADALAGGYRDAGDSARALAAWQRALSLLAADRGVAESDRVRLKQAIVEKMGNR